ncbi:hypothetical protein J3A83DRAFT_444001 [Scleroderma citrinum]
MDNLMADAIERCTSDSSSSNMEVRQNEEDSKGGKKQRDVKYCSGLQQTDLKPCGPIGKHQLTVFKTPNSKEPPTGPLEAFADVLSQLAPIFNLELEKFHIFWQHDDDELMGFNRTNAIYLNLAHFEKKHYAKLLGSDHGKAEVYIAWYFIIAHEIAHNIAFFHDEDHELLLTWIAQNRLTHLMNLLSAE